jgi:predicted Zn-dependent peptidase
MHHVQTPSVFRPTRRVTTFPSGLRVATAAMPHMESVSIGVWIGVGGRYEPKRISGISHFIEHLLFKGTRRRSAKKISQTVEGVGGYLNAFTCEETTCYYAKASHRHLDTLVDVLTDMYLHPLFAEQDIDKERQVIKEELLMYRDQPDHYVQELLLETVWPAHPLGRSLTGTAESLDRMERQTLLRFKQNKYVSANTVVAVAGRCTHDEIVERVERALPVTQNGAPPRFLPAEHRQLAPKLCFLSKNVEQSHLALALRGFSRKDPRRFALKLLSVIAGENMSSRLFQVIRERHGLAYSIQSSTTYFADTGAMTISAGLDTRRLEKALRIVLLELQKLAKRPPSTGELRRAKDYAVGQMRLGMESSTNQMMWIGEHLLAYGAIHTPEEIERKIEAVAAEQIQQVAAEIFRDNALNAAVITPSRDEHAVRGLLGFG